MALSFSKLSIRTFSTTFFFLDCQVNKQHHHHLKVPPYHCLSSTTSVAPLQLLVGARRWKTAQDRRRKMGQMTSAAFFLHQLNGTRQQQLLFLVLSAHRNWNNRTAAAPSRQLHLFFRQLIGIGTAEQQLLLIFFLHQHIGTREQQLLLLVLSAHRNWNNRTEAAPSWQLLLFFPPRQLIGIGTAEQQLLLIYIFCISILE